jgi:tRNA (mo5U34)-methyltransferase
MVTQAQADAFKWFHSIDLGDGVTTRGAKSKADLAVEMDVTFKHSLVGKSLLDIGAWDGAFTFEAERRGATVTAADGFMWAGLGWSSKAPFDLAHKAVRSKAKTFVMDVVDMTPRRVGAHDVVLFLGVLYHLQHPLLALERLADITKEMLVVETVTELNDLPFPAMKFYPRDELDHDASNWCGPNVECVSEMLRTVGFSRVEVTQHPTGGPYAAGRGRHFFHAFK